jgi:hypothetical protein
MPHAACGVLDLDRDLQAIKTSDVRDWKISLTTTDE